MMARRRGKNRSGARRRRKRTTAEQMRPDWTRTCIICGATPIVPLTEMCGPCTWGEAETVNGGWWEEDSEEAT